jgi:acyl-CoA dehydrogenase
VYQFGQHRKQFGIPLMKMEGVNEKWLDMLYQTWVIQSSVNMTNVLLEQGDRPAVISALMKQQTTERAREVINNGMDIHAGNAICVGHSNFMQKYYQSAPIGITVEGSNTLTRSLIIFGQGLNKSHPYIFPLLESVMDNDLQKFKTYFPKMISHTVGSYLKTYSPFCRELEKQTVNFAALANFLALKGGALKREQYLSGLVADYFSNLYLAYSVRWYQEQFKVSDTLTDYCLVRLLSENRNTLGKILQNERSLAVLFWHLNTENQDVTFTRQREILEEVKNNTHILEHIKQDLYLHDNILEDLENLEKYDKDSAEYQKIYQRVINVGEYDNMNLKSL